jgi:hypothetical protein
VHMHLRLAEQRLGVGELSAADAGQRNAAASASLAAAPSADQVTIDVAELSRQSRPSRRPQEDVRTLPPAQKAGSTRSQPGAADSSGVTSWASWNPLAWLSRQVTPPSYSGVSVEVTDEVHAIPQPTPQRRSRLLPTALLYARPRRCVCGSAHVPLSTPPTDAVRPATARVRPGGRRWFDIESRWSSGGDRWRGRRRRSR